MRFRRSSHRRFLRSLGIVFLILGLVPVPLPRVDFHDVRHHDAPGEVCGFHDHLLVWHPDAGHSEDVAVWHCHWLPANLGLSDVEPAGDGPAAHAHIPDPPPLACCDTPRIVSATPSASAGGFASWAPAALMIPPTFEGVAPAPTPSPPAASSVVPHVSITLRLQRLIC